MSENDDESPADTFDGQLAAKLMGSTLLIGITQLSRDGGVVGRQQVSGVVTEADRTRGICVRVESSGRDFWLPPDTRGIQTAEPGEYRNRTTGEVVVDPDYLGSWEVWAAE